jgi:hypothetical protein
MSIEHQLKDAVADAGLSHPSVCPDPLHSDLLFITIQLIGDGYRHLRRTLIISFALKILGLTKFEGLAASLYTAAIWECAEDYATIKCNTHELCVIFRRPLREGLSVDFRDGRAKCRPSSSAVVT